MPTTLAPTSAPAPHWRDLGRRLIGALLLYLSITTVHGDPLRVVTEHWPPFNHQENGEVVGLSSEIVRATLERAGLNYQIEVLPWARAYRRASQTPNTLIYTIARTAEREAQFKWIGPFAERRIHLFKLKTRQDIQISRFEDLKAYRIAIYYEDATHQELLKLGFPPEQLALITAENSNTLMLARGRVDLIPGNAFSLAHQLEEPDMQGILNYQELEKAWLLFDQGGYYMAFNRETPDELVERVRQAFVQLEREGRIQQLIERYFASH